MVTNSLEQLMELRQVLYLQLQLPDEEDDSETADRRDAYGGVQGTGQGASQCLDVLTNMEAS